MRPDFIRNVGDNPPVIATTPRSVVLTFLRARAVYDSSSHILWFRALGGFRLVRCGVTRDALLKLAGRSVRESAVPSVYEANLLRIRALAQQKYQERRLELDGAILVGHADL